jgi:hypothetical protein
LSSGSSLSPDIGTGNKPLRRARYRAGQFWRGLSARITAQDYLLAAQILSPQALAFFDRMPMDSQRHSLNVLHAVRTTGLDNLDLDTAALLHDIGKLAAEDGGVRLNLWLRSPLALLQAWSPRTLRRIASANPSAGWRYTAYVHLEHPRIGAEWAARAGCSDLTCWLIRHHQDDPAGVEGSEHRHRLLTILQAADNSS